MSFYGIDAYVHLGMLFARLLDLSEDGHTVQIKGTTIQVGDKVIGIEGNPLTMANIEDALRSVTIRMTDDKGEKCQ